MKNDVRKPHRLRSNASTYWLQRELQLKTPPEQVRIHSETRSNSKYDETFDVAFLVFWGGKNFKKSVPKFLTNSKCI